MSALVDAPVVSTEEVRLCPVCSGAQSLPLARGYDYELGTCGNLWCFVRCVACGHAWLNPRPAVSELGVIYPATYYSYNYASAVSPLALRAKAWLDGRKMAGIIRHTGGAPRGYLDIGCGDGRFLRAARDAGVSRVHGLELNEDVARQLTEEGFQVSCERVEDCSRIPDASLNLVTMFHVIEHVADPATVVRRVASWLAPGGVFAVETPNLDSLDARLFSDGFWGGYHIPRHWHVFTPHSLAWLLNGAGLDIVATQYQTGHSFWMYSLHHTLKYRLDMPRLARLFDPFGGSLPLLAMFTAWDKVRATLGFRTSAMLLIARKR